MRRSTVWLGVTLITGVTAMAWPFLTGRVNDVMYVMAAVAAATSAVLSAIEERK